MKVFISYRRADSAATAGRMAQFLDGIPAVDEVFLDVDGIAPGERFEQKIRDTLAQVSHVFVLMGPLWAGPAGVAGAARIFDDSDLVRRETRLALTSGTRLVPILLDNARMPSPGELPPDIQALSAINAFALRTERFDEDMDTLLDQLLGGRPGRGSRWRRPPLTAAGIALRAASGLVGGAALLLVVALANHLALGGDADLAGTIKRMFGLASDADALGLLWTIAGAVLALGALAPFVPRWLRRARPSRATQFSIDRS